MSSRAVRKILKERGYDDLAETAAQIEKRAQEMGEANNGSEGEDNSSSGSDNQKSQGPMNPFALLGGDDSDDGDAELDSDGEEAIGHGSKDDEKEEEREETRTSKSRKSRKSKKSKKKSKKHRGKEAEEMSMEEFEAQLKAHKESVETSTGPVGNEAAKAGLWTALSAEQQSNRALISVEARHLDAEAEIKRLFGSVAVTEGAKRKVPLSRLPKRLHLSHPKLSWPPLRGSAGVEMFLESRETADPELQKTMDDDETGGMWFGIRHSARFQAAHVDFLAAVQTNNADAIAALAYHHPYQVDALLQMSEIIKQTGGDFGEAAELVERALYAFETGFDPKFNITVGLSRLDFRRVESRSLFLAVFRHMQFVARRGCWRTVFELNKVLLGFDPQRDPYGALLTLDFYALKARQYEYVRSFVREWTWSQIDIPNWAYSRALAEFLIEGNEESRVLLANAILRFPSVVPLLFTKANVDVDAVILTHPYFQPEQVPDDPSKTCMELLVHLFVERSYSLYRTPEVSRWLKEGLMLALERIAANEQGGAVDLDIELMEKNKKRLCTYVIPENICRHMLVADMEQLKAALPEEIRSAETFAFDPLPPKNDINVYNELMIAGERGVMPGGFSEHLQEQIAGIDPADPGVIERLIGGIRRRLGLGDGELAEDPGTSDDEEVEGRSQNQAIEEMVGEIIGRLHVRGDRDRDDENDEWDEVLAVADEADRQEQERE